MNDSKAYYEVSFEAAPGEGADEYHRVDVQIDKPGLTARDADRVLRTAVMRKVGAGKLMPTGVASWCGNSFSSLRSGFRVTALSGALSSGATT